VLVLLLWVLEQLSLTQALELEWLLELAPWFQLVLVE